MASEMTSNDTNKEEVDFQSISELFDEGMELYNQVMTKQSSQAETHLIRAIKVLENVTQRLSDSKLFTLFKTLHDVPTTHLKLFLIPALLGFLSVKPWHSDKREMMHVAYTYFKDFLGRARSFGLFDPRPPGIATLPEVVETPPTPPHAETLHLADVNLLRDAKLERHTQQVAMQKHLSDLKKQLELLEQMNKSTSQGPMSSKRGVARRKMEAQIKRNYDVTMIRWFANQVIEEMEIMECEHTLINYMADLNLGPSFFQEELKSKLGKLPQMKTSKPVLISNGKFLDDSSTAELKHLHEMLHGNFYEILFQDPLVPYPPTPQPSTPVESPAEEVIHSVIPEENEEAESQLIEAEIPEPPRAEEAENKAKNDKPKGKKKKK